MLALRAFAFSIAFVTSLAVSSAGGAEDPHALLRRGVALQRDASWSSSIAALEKARASGALSSAEQAECAFYLAASYVAIGSEAAARRELTLVLELQPAFEPPPYTSPKVASLLGEVLRDRSNAPSLEARPPRGEKDGALELGFEARRARAPIYGVVRYRLRGEDEFREAPLVLREGRADGPLRISAQVRPERGGVLEYYAEALSPMGTLAVGSPSRLLELPIGDGLTRARPSAPRGTSKWVWSAIPIGAVVGAALGVGLFYGLRAADR